MPNKPPRKASGDKAPGPSTPCHFFHSCPYLFPFHYSFSFLTLRLGSWTQTLPDEMRNTIWLFAQGPQTCIPFHDHAPGGSGPRTEGRPGGLREGGLDPFCGNEMTVTRKRSVHYTVQTLSPCGWKPRPAAGVPLAHSPASDGPWISTCNQCISMPYPGQAEGTWTVP